MKQVSIERADHNVLFCTVYQLLKRPCMGLNAPLFARHKSADQPLQEIIWDGDDEVLDPLLTLSDTIRSGLVNFFLHVAQ